MNKDWDLGTCLKNECNRKQLRTPHSMRSWIDLRATYRVSCKKQKFTTDRYWSFTFDRAIVGLITCIISKTFPKEALNV